MRASCLDYLQIRTMSVGSNPLFNFVVTSSLPNLYVLTSIYSITDAMYHMLMKELLELQIPKQTAV